MLPALISREILDKLRTDRAGEWVLLQHVVEILIHCYDYLIAYI